MSNVVFFAVDFETTGLHAHQGDEVLSCGAQLLDADLNAIDKKLWYIHPSSPDKVSAEAQKINGYTPELWEQRGAISQDAFFTALIAHWKEHNVQRAYPLGQNVGFDVSFLDARAAKDPAFARAMRGALAYHKIDTIPIALAWDYAHGYTHASYSLGKIAARRNVDLSAAHTADADIEATVQVFRSYINEMAGATAPSTPTSRFVATVGDEYVFIAGKHIGIAVKEVDRSYLEFLCTLPIDPADTAILKTYLT